MSELWGGAEGKCLCCHDYDRRRHNLEYVTESDTLRTVRASWRKQNSSLKCTVTNASWDFIYMCEYLILMGRRGIGWFKWNYLHCCWNPSTDLEFYSNELFIFLTKSYQAWVRLGWIYKPLSTFSNVYIVGKFKNLFGIKENWPK
jgi:hypothetical protein